MKLFKGGKTEDPMPIAVVSSQGLQTLVQQVVATMPGFPMSVLSETNPVSAAENLDLTKTNVLLVEADLSEQGVSERLEDLSKKAGQSCTLVIVAHNVDSRTTRKLFRAGAADVLSFPVSPEDLTTSLVMALAPRSAPVQRSSIGKIISVQKCGGGVGATMLVANLGLLLSQDKDSTSDASAKILLIDLDPQFGNLASVTHCEPRASILQLIEAGNRLDQTLFEAATQPVSAGLDLLPAPQEILPFSALSPDFVSRLLDIAVASYDYVVIDHPQNWGGQSHPVFSRSDLTILAMEANVEHADRAQAVLAGLTDLGLSISNTLVVINKTLGLQHFDRIQRIEKVLQRPVETIPFKDKIHRPAREQSKFISAIPGAKSQVKSLSKVMQTGLELMSTSRAMDQVTSGAATNSSISGAM